nr:oligosaccharide flippase family protein [Shuttleworthia satelles]
MKLARTKNTLRNTLWGTIYRVVTLIGPFAVKTLIVRRLGIEYSGLSSLFTSILTVLNLTNLGFSSSIVFTMYRAIVDDDIDAQCAMLRFYRHVYRIVGFVILGLGLVIMPFLPHLVNGECPADINLYTLFAIYLAETSLDYLMFAYVTAIFTAYQRNDITLKISTVRYIVQYAVQAAVLILFPNYYAYIIVLPLMVIPNNIANYLAARKEYPKLTCRGSLDAGTKKDIYKRVGTLFGHKLGSTVLVSTDSIIISAFLGLTTMGIYGNYYYVLTAVNALVEIVTNGALSGIGNKLVTDSKDENYALFRTLSYGWMLLIGIAAACMLCLYQPFIAGIWYDENYLLDIRLVVLIVIYFYSWMFRIMQLTYRDAAGLWTRDWLKPYIAMAVNIVGSIWMVKATGSIAGVLLPTIFCFLAIYYPWEAWVIFKCLFNGGLKNYFVTTVFYTLISLLACAASYAVCVFLAPSGTAASFLIRLPVTLVICCAVWWCFTHRSKEYERLKGMLRRIIRRQI